MRPRTRFEQLAMPHLNAAHTLAYWLVRNRADAEDIVQDAYIRALRAFASFRGGDIRPWLLTIVRNAAYRWLSVRQRASNVIPIEDAFSARDPDAKPVLELASDEPSAEARLIGAQDHARVRAALAALTPVFREVLVLREIEELSYADIATIIETPVGTVMSRLSRARTELRTKLKAMIDKDERHAL
jgi:RNA polymerase sigma-70 factor (ECF subfamily)